MSLLHFFRRADYTSDITNLIDQLKAEKPDLETNQRAGRALYWDKVVNREAWSEWRKADVAQKPYVYQNDVK